MTERLAIDGGRPHITEAFPMWPAFDEKNLTDVLEPLRSGKVNYWTGKKGQAFERAWAAYCGAGFCVTTSNGTSALHTALGALGIGPGDEVICPSYTFIASSMCVAQAGAIPVFADVNREDHMISAADIARKITDRTKAIVVVHLYGIVADMDPILAIARRHGLKVIEDCAQAHGGMYKGRKVGTIGDAGCFSFCQSKHFTTGGEGGAVVTDDEDLAWECRSFRDHGYDVRARLNLLEAEGKLPYIHRRIGFNYRMTEIQSIIGLNELARFESWNLPARRRNGRIVIDGLRERADVLYTPVDTPERRNAFWWAPVVLDIDAFSADTKQILAAMAAEGVPMYGIQWPESYREEAYVGHRGFGRHNFPFESREYTNPDSVRYDAVACPNARWLRDRTVCFFVHPVYPAELMTKSIEAFGKVLDAYRHV
ncbi:MAG: DegT/DnrJ/EryC1/StrS family aminotransferase [Kiritimatiellae bacterium]|nr:DegT/DnrJ/EryC1/StrS family aminotransferase [Kiritimatiellia bacterium]